MVSTRRINSTACYCALLISIMTRSATAFTTIVNSKVVVVSPSASSTASRMRVAYQGEPGAYSEKSTRELLGTKVVAIGRPDFESCFQAVASMECDYCCLPIENSLGGSIHENYDLMLRYDLTICAEHDFRVQHCVLAMPGVELEQIKYAISHPQALAQCDNYLRGLGITPIPTYDTAGSAKMISENRNLPPGCTQQNICAIASDLAGRTYGLNCLAKGVEDDDTNFTRFLLLGRKGVTQYLNKNIPSKTSIVFTLPNSAGALYKSLACFSLRDIDCSKIESRPTSATLLNYLKFRSKQNGQKSKREASANLPRFRYSFYLDFLASELDENTENALAHLREMADYVRVLGSYPQKSRLVGPIATAVEELKNTAVDEPKQVTIRTLPSDATDTTPLNIGIVGFGAFGQFLATRFSNDKHHVSCLDQADKSGEARKLGITYHPNFDVSNFLKDVDIVVLAVPLIDLADAVESLPIEALRGKLVVDVCPLNSHPKAVMKRVFRNAPEVDILCTNPMFGPATLSTEGSWDGRPMVYEKVRVSNMARCDKFLNIFEEARCNLVEMSSEQHDATTANAEFVTHLVGRLLDQKLLPATPVMSKEYAALCDVADMTAADSFDLFFGKFKYNDKAKDLLTSMREGLANIERELAAREAYLAAKSEMKKTDRQRLLAETRLLIMELAKNGGLAGVLESEEAAAPGVDEKADSASKEAPETTK